LLGVQFERDQTPEQRGRRRAESGTHRRWLIGV
jgi:hypothetical protein